jgi:hypothetical protein
MPRTPPPLRQAIPPWQELMPQLQTDLLTLLTRLLQHHLAHAAADTTEVADDHP